MCARVQINDMRIEIEMLAHSYILAYAVRLIYNGPMKQRALSMIFFALFMLFGSLSHASEKQKLQQLLDADWKWRLKEFPEYATYVGEPGHDRDWTDLSPEAIKRRKKRNEALYEQIKRIDRGALTAADRLNYDLFRYDLEDELESDRFPGELLAVNQLDGIQSDVPQLIGVMPSTKPAHFENMIARLAKLPGHVDQVIALLKEGLRKKVTAPRVVLGDVPAQIDRLIAVDDPLKSPILAPFKEAPQERLKSEAVAVFKAKVAPAFQKLRDFMTETYIPGASESVSMSALPDGKAWYAYRARHYTTTKMSPQQIHELGLSEVKRIRNEMEKVIVSTGFKGDFNEFNDFLRTDDKFFFDTADELLRAYRDIAKRTDPQLTKLFGKLPRLPYGVVPVPSYSEKVQPTAYYMPGAPEAGRAGYFYANTYNLRARPKWEMEALVMHEAVPGHHLQIALAQELEDVPKFRKDTSYTAFIEGWGLYAESLGYELGMYKDPYSNYGQLSYEMWRAIRLVVDTGIHSMGWTRQQAINYFKANSSKAEHDIEVEVDRYIGWGGQALAYKIGQLKFRELREKARAALGERFEIRAFHDAVLGNGALPLSVLEARINDWLRHQK